jgi:hypothetical protein
MKNAIVFKFAILSASALALSPLCGAQAQIAGDWLGTLSAGGAQVHLALHIKAAEDGSLTATLDSADQGAYGIPVATITLKDSNLNLAVDAVHATYEGTVNKDATEIDGTWTQGMPLDLTFNRGRATPAPAAAKLATPSDIDGSWTGTLDAGGAQLRIIFRIVNTQDGLTAQMQSPDQVTIWIAASSVTRAGDTLTITLQGLGATFEGRISADRGTIDGTFTQGAANLPLLLKLAKS